MNYAPASEKGNQVQKILTKEYIGQPTWYVFQFTKGWVIVSADDAVRPVLGYSFDGKIDDDLNNLQNPFVNRFSYYDRQIVHNVREKGYVDDKSKAEWKDIENKIFPKDSKDIVVDALTETKWGQGWPWNEMCPLDGELRTLTGCVATTMGQIMMYHKAPPEGYGSNSYFWTGQFTSDTLTSVFKGNKYSFEVMPLENCTGITDYEIRSVSDLLFDCGVAVNTDYGLLSYGGSTVHTVNLNSIISAFINNFSFSSEIEYLRAGTISDPAAFSNDLQGCLTDSIPIFWIGSDLEGHAFILDGCTVDNWYHINWGWNGFYDGWYQLSDLTPGTYNFTINQAGLTKLKPANHPPSPSPPDNFTAELYGNENVRLEWTINFDDPVDHYEIFRNGVIHDEVPGSYRSYIDRDIPEGKYLYYIRAALPYNGNYFYTAVSGSKYVSITLLPGFYPPVLKSVEPQGITNVCLEWEQTNETLYAAADWESGCLNGWTERSSKDLDSGPSWDPWWGYSEERWIICDSLSLGDPDLVRTGLFSAAIDGTAGQNSEYCLSWLISPPMSLTSDSVLDMWIWYVNNEEEDIYSDLAVFLYKGDFTEPGSLQVRNNLITVFEWYGEAYGDYGTNRYQKLISKSIPYLSGEYRLCVVTRYTGGNPVAVDDLRLYNKWSDKSDITANTGYEIYRNGMLIDIINDSSARRYNDPFYSDGWNQYYVKSLYPEGVSAPSFKGGVLMIREPSPKSLTANYDPSCATVELKWKSPTEHDAGWYGNMFEQPDAYWDHIPSYIDQKQLVAYKNRTLFNADADILFPCLLDSVSAFFYKSPLQEWVSDQFFISIYVKTNNLTDSIIYGPSGPFTAVSGEQFKLGLPGSLYLDRPWYVEIDPYDNTKGHPGIYSSSTLKPSNSTSLVDTYTVGVSADWNIIKLNSMEQEWWIFSHIIPVSDAKNCSEDYFNYNIYRNSDLIATTDSTYYTDTLSREQTTADYHVTAFYENPPGESEPSNIVTVTITSVEDNIPFETTLSQNYPNPFNPETNIRFSIASDTKVSLKIYNTAGQLVAAPVDRFMKRGSYNIGLNASKLSGGVYICKLEADGKELTKKMTVVK